MEEFLYLILHGTFVLLYMGAGGGDNQLSIFLKDNQTKEIYNSYYYTRGGGILFYYTVTLIYTLIYSLHLRSS